MKDTRNKIPAIYLNDETHQAIKKLAQYQGTTMPKLAQALLEQMQPVLVNMVETYESILGGKDKDKALIDMVAKGLMQASQTLSEDD